MRRTCHLKSFLFPWICKVYTVYIVYTTYIIYLYTCIVLYGVVYHLTFFLPCLLTRQSQPWILLVFFARPFEDSSFQHLGGGYQLTEGEFVAAGERCMGTSFIFFLALMMFPELFFNQIAPKNWISKAGLKMKHRKEQVCEARTQSIVSFKMKRWPSRMNHTVLLLFRLHQWVSWGVGCIFFLSGKPLRFREDLIIASQGFSGRQQIWKRCWKNMNKLFFSWFNYCRSRPLKTEMEPENHHFP